MTDTSVLDLNSRREALLNKHRWVKALYNQAEEWANEYEELEEEIKTLKASNNQLESEVKLLPAKEVRLNETHIMVEHNYWRDMKSKCDDVWRLKGQVELRSRALWILTPITILQLFALLFHHCPK